MKPFPSELQSTINPEPNGKHTGVECQRNLFCNHYDDCLDEAVKKGWNSFTCVRCPHYALTSATASASVGIEGYATQRRLA